MQLLALMGLICCATVPPLRADQGEKSKRPNILLIMADDASRDSFGAYGSPDISTPGFDWIARKGVLFTNAYNCNPKCAPARASLLIGRYSWQLEESCNHGGFMSDKWEFYPYLLENAGYRIGYTGKGWGPGEWHGYSAGKEKHRDNPAGHPFNKITAKPPYKGINSIDYAGNFEAFLNSQSDESPFCFWMGVKEPHRGYGLNNWKLDGRDLSKIKVPDYLPDNATIRGDLADYAIEVEWFDKHIDRAIRLLRESDLLENTLIIATSDHGMPFPRVKGQIYDDGFHVPLAICWKGRFPAGRRVDDFVTFPDIAPTLMELAQEPSGTQMTGRSFVRQLLSDRSGMVDPARDHTLLGKERHDIGRTDGNQRSVGYPVRAIRTSQYLYARNFKPHRWPVGDPDLGLRNCDNSPSKQYLLNLTPDSPEFKFYELSFGLRPDEELYLIQDDPDCVRNFAADPQYREVCDQLWSRMKRELEEQGDPRILGQGDIFDAYPNSNISAQRALYKDPDFDPVGIYEKRFGQPAEPSSPSSIFKPNH